MRQHVMQSRWTERNGPRVLFEDANSALAVSDFTAFREAGFEVAACSGPNHAIECPLLRGQECQMVAEADVIVFGPDRLFGVGREVLETICRRYPETAKLVEVARRGPEGRYELPDCCDPMPFPMSVGGQVDAVRAAVRSKNRVLR